MGLTPIDLCTDLLLCHLGLRTTSPTQLSATQETPQTVNTETIYAFLFLSSKTLF